MTKTCSRIGLRFCCCSFFFFWQEDKLVFPSANRRGASIRIFHIRPERIRRWFCVQFLRFLVTVRDLTAIAECRLCYKHNNKLFTVLVWTWFRSEMGPKLHEFSVVLQRESNLVPWGFRLVGGCDLDMPLIVTKVGAGNLSTPHVFSSIRKSRQYAEVADV